MAKLQTAFSGHRVLEKAKYKAIRQFINDWLLDPTIYCNTCGFPYFSGEKPCCDNPLIGKNIQHCQALLLQIAAERKCNLNEYGSNKDKTLRHALSLPPDLIRKLERFCQEKLGEKLFVNTKDLRGFMKAFPQFVTMERI